MTLSIHEKFQSYVGPIELKLTLKAGECIGLLGPNGAGKSTILHYLKLNQKRIFSEYGVTFLDQGRFPTLNHLSAMDLLDLLGKNFSHRLRYPVSDSPLHELFPLGDKLHKPLSSLSGGEFQQVKLLALFSMKAQSYFLDEPFTHLDQKKSLALLSYLEELKAQGQNLVIIHHSWGMLWPLIDEVAHVPKQSGEWVQVEAIPKDQFQGAP